MSARPAAAPWPVDLVVLALQGIRDDTGAGSDVDTWEDAARSTGRLDDQASDT